MSIQKTDWGEIFWLDEEEKNGLQTGIVTLLKGAHQPKHIHYEEQSIYVIQGEALSIINGNEYHLKPGDMYHWQAGVEHEIFNEGDTDFQHLLVSNPGQEERLQLFRKQMNVMKKYVMQCMMRISQHECSGILE